MALLEGNDGIEQPRFSDEKGVESMNSKSEEKPKVRC